MGMGLSYTTNMRTSKELSEDLQKGANLMVGALREAAGNDLSAEALMELLEVTFTGRNQLDAALTTAVGALDHAVKQLPYATLPDNALSCAQWLSYTQHISEKAAYAQVQLARRLPELTPTARAMERGEISVQHAGVVARSVESVVRGGGEPGMAENMLLDEARARTPHELFRWGLSLVHQLAPEEMDVGARRDS